MTPDLDLTRAQWTKTREGVTAIGTWIRIEKSFRPCMVLIPAGREKDERMRPCVITQDRAWIWDDRIGDPDQSAPLAMDFAHTLGLSAENPRTVIRLAMFICDMLGDLLTIPPYQADNRNAVADATLFDGDTGEVLRETEIFDG
jgi:hypothetical protein